jgi:hypothetical protein
MLSYTFIAYVSMLWLTVWKWLTGLTDRTCTDPLQATALTHIIRLQVSNSLQYPSELINTFSVPKLLGLNTHSDIFSGIGRNKL